MKKMGLAKFPVIIHWVMCLGLAIYSYGVGDKLSGDVFLASALVIGGLSGD